MLRQLDCVLEPKKDKVIALDENDEMPEVMVSDNSESDERAKFNKNADDIILSYVTVIRDLNRSRR